ncbi:Rrf2 family transcriptional regulator [Altererythrobacter xixiisoli]|uniref:Rrf2 family transcriptional regulator n=1 Tax=Croceibacterium xixiisoli TaxID=1476466 RepID=A0A6I4TWG4_9SPHN|nr:Rrf2 family transcriptional regulator [Croceibacterium xixiisoli]MXO99559.1 Rrf2 family transcriptional regulator [Croceibacterium xixiisoli]
MRLTRYTDYAMRVLLYCAQSSRDAPGDQQAQLVSIARIARAYDISQNHLMKVVNDLVNAGYLESVRGRSGGIRLARPADQINIGALVRHTEDGFDLLECGNCVIAPACGLTGVMAEALRAFLAVLDGYTLADVLGRRADFLFLLESAERPAPPGMA